MPKIDEVIKYARECLAYDEHTGILTRISASAMSKRLIGKRAGAANTNGYRYVRILRKLIAEHRVAWYLVYGYLPEMIDHINGDKSDNRLCNLRAATKSNNSMNRPKPASNKSGFKGVWFNAASNKYQAQITAGGTKHYLGVYATAELAHSVYQQAAKDLHKEFARTK